VDKKNIPFLLFFLLPLAVSLEAQTDNELSSLSTEEMNDAEK